MVEFIERDLTGSRFKVVDLSGSRFSDLNLSGALFRGAWADRLELDGDFDHLVVNGVDVMPFVRAEMDRLDPERPLMRPKDADGFRVAWPIIERRWAETVERARRLPPEMLDEQVDEEWSFIQTLRHLLMATDAWVLRALLGDPAPYHPLGLPHSEMDDPDGILPNDLDARPGLDEVLSARADRMATVGEFIARLTDEQLASMTEPVLEPGYPEPESYPVRRCIGAIINEEWEHRRFAERDLAILEARLS
ncbi:DinB family protein [Nocardioides conyzicola]|uniref:DinB family protein n=1 Tax=Nocardioides conyzicola TaxID=1651781 RepID=A0ABP8WSI3_9ACTN